MKNKYFTNILLLIIITFTQPQSIVASVNDPEYSNQWIQEFHNITSVWQYGYDFRDVSDAVSLCVLGGPIVTDQHGDLEVTEKKSFAYNESGTGFVDYPGIDATDREHEAFSASVAASLINNSIGIAGVANMPLYSALVGGGSNTTRFINSIRLAIEWCSTKGKIAVTMGFWVQAGTYYNSNEAMQLRTSIVDLYDTGNILYFVAAGNVVEPLNTTTIPHTYDHIHMISKNNRYGNYDSGTTGPNLFITAPGLEVWAYSQKYDRYENFGGTSASSPITAAAAVLLWNQFPWANNTQIEAALKWGATDIENKGWDEKTGWGLLNVEKSREYLVEYIPTESLTSQSSSQSLTTFSDITSITSTKSSSSITYLLPSFWCLTIIYVNKRRNLLH